MPVNNNLFQKNANISLVSQLIWRKKRISRVDIARELSLYRSTVSNIISYLLSSSIVIEGNQLSSTFQGGRKATELSLNRNFGCVFGFDLQVSHYRAVLLALDGTTLWTEVGTFGSLSFKKMIDSVIEKAKKVFKDLEIPILAVSFSIPGIVDSENGVVSYSEPFKITESFNLREYVKEKIDCPVYVENDANCAAWMDIYSSDNKILENALAVVGDFHENKDVGIGVGLAVIINGSVYRGSHNASGEFCSLSWKALDANQSGLDVDVLKKTQEDKNCLKLWLEDTFNSLVPLCSVMDFEKVILHGNTFRDQNWVLSVLKEKASAFIGVLEKTNTELVFDAKDECLLAKGAATMVLHYLFSVPGLDKTNSQWMSWDEMINFAKEQQRGSYGKIR